MAKYIVAITGGISSGKSTVAKLFEQLNVPVVDADEIAHELTQAGSPFVDMIAHHFGNSVINSDRTLNRKLLSQIIFANFSEKSWLENLLHPPICQLLFQRADFFQSPYCVVVIPLLSELLKKENDFAKLLHQKINRIIVVDASTMLQKQRTIARDNTSLSQINNIIHNQALRSQRINFADDLITNNGDMTHLKDQVEKLHQKYLKLS